MSIETSVDIHPVTTAIPLQHPPRLRYIEAFEVACHNDNDYANAISSYIHCG